MITRDDAIHVHELPEGRFWWEHYASEPCGCRALIGAIDRVPTVKLEPCSDPHGDAFRRHWAGIDHKPGWVDIEASRALTGGVRSCDARASTERAGFA